MSLVLNGTTQYLTIADAAVLTLPDGDWTIAGWIKVASNEGSFVQYIISCGAVNANNSLNIYLAEAGDAVPNKLTLALRDATNSAIARYGSTSVGSSTMVWQHIAIVRSSNVLTSYVDGNVDTAPLDIATLLDSIDGTGAWCLGSRSATPIAARMFNGRMAEWAKWDSALSTEEIQTLLAGGQPGDVDAENLTWWLPLFADKDSDAGELTTAVEGSAVFDDSDHPVYYEGYANDLMVWSVKAIADTPPGPQTAPTETLSLSTRMCRGEYGSLSFCIRTLAPCTVTLSTTDVADAPDLDLFWVKQWWQSPVSIFTSTTVPVLTPGPLLKNPTIITANLDKTNTPAATFVDAETIQPLVISANYTQQVWITVHVPAGTATGTYTLPVTVTVSGELFETFNVTVEVLAFELAASPMSHGVYYVSGTIAGPHTHEARTLAQVGAELIDIAKHGCKCVIQCEEYNQLFQGEAQIAALEALLALHTAAGLSIDKLYLVRTPITQGGNTWEDMVEKLPTFFSVLAAAGATEVYCYGRDEPTAEQMAVSKTYYDLVHSLGGKTMTALIGRSADALSVFGTSLDRPLFSDDTVDLAPWTALGISVWRYQAVIFQNVHESHYRKSYGLESLRNGYGGTCPVFYRCKFGASWFNDLDTTEGLLYRDHLFTLPTTTGSISLLPWEAYREAINDVRFAQTLINLGGTCPEPGADLDVTREAMIDNIIALNKSTLVLNL
jgi:hypothetical protein